MNSALGVMWHRQVKEYLRNKQRLLVSMVQPTLFLIAFGFGLGSSFAGDVDYISYLLPGIVAMTVMMNSTMGGMSLIWDKKFGFLKETLVAPVSRTSLLFGRCLGGATTSVVQGLVVLMLGYLIMGFRLSNLALLPVIVLAMGFVALFFSLLGTSLATRFDDFQSFPMIMNFLMMPMMFLSGAFFPVGNFPGVLQVVIAINPFNYAVNLLRFLMSGIETNLGLAIGVLVGLIVLIGGVGTRLFERMEV